MVKNPKTKSVPKSVKKWNTKTSGISLDHILGVIGTTLIYSTSHTWQIITNLCYSYTRMPSVVLFVDASNLCPKMMIDNVLSLAHFHAFKSAQFQIY